LDENETLLAASIALIQSARARGYVLRLIGGIAVRALCPTSRSAPFARRCGDADFASIGRAHEAEEFFASQGWTADSEFNLYNGPARLSFRANAMKADVFVGSFRMCHEVPLNGRAAVDDIALPLAELLLTKLQVVKANDKDLADAACLLIDHELGSGDGRCINLGVLARACAADWGLWRTTGISLGKLRAWLEASPIGEAARSSALERVSAISEALEAEPKTMRWRMRSAVGDRLPWYELPEEVDR
jgi:hypothetical protein